MDMLNPTRSSLCQNIPRADICFFPENGEHCRASHTGDAIRVMYSSVSVGVVHVLWRARRCRAQCDVLFIS